MSYGGCDSVLKTGLIGALPRILPLKFGNWGIILYICG